MKSIQYFVLVIFFVLDGISATTCNATEVVRANFMFQGATYPVDLSLDDADAPISVANFLKYIDGGLYTNLIINRSVYNFVIQTGGYTYDSSVGPFTYDASSGTFNGGLRPVSDFGPITNEATLSNLRGTIAMALIGGNPDSATNQWFINLSDNTFLDTSVTLFGGTSPGYTVFGNVLSNGMDTIDKISALPVYDLSSNIDYNGAFTSVPLANYTTGTPVTSISDPNLSEISSMERLFSLPSLIKFTDAVPTDPPQSQNITITNNNAAPLTIGTVDTSTITAPFSVTPSCAGVTLTQGQQCSMQLQFSPSTTGYFINTLNIGISTYGYTFPVTIRTPLPIIKPNPAAVDFGAQPVCDPTSGPCQQTIIYVHDNGEKPLEISSITFNTPTPGDFQFTDNCTPANTNNGFVAGQVSPGKYCVLVLNFTPTDLAVKTGTISIKSDDPVNGTVTIPVTGGTTTDTDGIDNTTEDASPNNGDNNNDGIPDKLQSYVASFPAIQNIYTSLITDSSLSFSSVVSVPLSTLDPLPQGVKLGDGAFSFELSGFTAGSTVQFGLILPNGSTPTNVYSFGPTTDNNSPHWYALQNNASPGTAIIGNASLSNPSGNGVTRNLTQIQIQDGGYGDSDMQVNGKILFVGGPEITNTSNASGGVLWILFMAPAPIIIFRKKSRSSR